MKRRQMPTREELRRTVRRWDPKLHEDSDGFEAALVMLAALYLGNKDIGKLSRATGVRPKKVCAFACNLDNAGVWTKDGKTVAQWDSPGNSGETAFWCDVLVACGLFALKQGGSE